MKVLHVGKYYSPFVGGIESFLSSLLHSQAGSGIHHFILAHHHKLWRQSDLSTRDEGQVFRAFTLCRLLFTPIAPFFYFNLKKVLAHYKPDIIHVHMPNPSAFWLLLLTDAREIPIIVHWHADVIASRKNFLLGIAYFFSRPLEKKLLEKASTIVVTSPNYLESSIPLKPWHSKCQVIPLGLEVDESADTANTANYWTRQDAFKVLCVGRLTYYKGQEYLIHAVSMLDNIELIMVGTGKFESKYRQLIEALGCKHKVRLFGHAEQAELLSLMAGCDCLCLPSIERTEAFGLVLLEAMGASKPCICTDVEGSGMSWVVQNGETGLVVKAADTPALQEALLLLDADREYARQLGISGHQRLNSYFSLARVADQIARLYNQVIINSSHAHQK